MSKVEQDMVTLAQAREFALVQGVVAPAIVGQMPSVLKEYWGQAAEAIYFVGVEINDPLAWDTLSVSVARACKGNFQTFGDYLEESKEKLNPFELALLNRANALSENWEKKWGFEGDEKPPTFLTERVENLRDLFNVYPLTCLD